MEIKTSLALETALEFISEVATCKDEERGEKAQLAHSFINSLEEEIEEERIRELRTALRAIQVVRLRIVEAKKEGK